jgi:adenylate cyclase
MFVSDQALLGSPSLLRGDGFEGGHAVSSQNQPLNDALEQHKQEGLQLAVRARWVALVVIGVLVIYLTRSWTVIYYEFILVLFGLIAWGQSRVGRHGRSRLELVLMFADIALLTFVLLVPNPFRTQDWPLAMQFRFDGMAYFYVFLMGAALSCSWRTILTVGMAAIILWTLGVAWVMAQPVSHPDLSVAIRQAVSSQPGLFELLDPNSVLLPNRVQDVIVFGLATATLALVTWRSDRLLRRQANLERERTNLSRYFSPNVVEELALNDQPLKQVRAQNVAVLFVDIVGFTAYADQKEPAAVIQTLREFLALMEAQVFANGGTLDKYLGDGLMATFGTPLAGDRDASSALRCGKAMLAALRDWNGRRLAQGEPAIQIGIGIHYGPVVTGNIGGSRLEFAVIGSTVNLASRLEALTRTVSMPLIASDALVDRIAEEAGPLNQVLDGLIERSPEALKGISTPVRIWSFTLQ